MMQKRTAAQMAWFVVSLSLPVIFLSSVRLFLIAILPFSPSDFIHAFLQDSAWLFFGCACCVLVFIHVLPKITPSNREECIFLMLLIFLLSLPLTVPGIGQGFDFSFHLARIEGLFEGLKSGQFPVKMTPFFNANHGFPVSIFYGDLLLYFPALLRLGGVSPLLAVKCYILFIHAIAVIVAYFCFFKISRDKPIALLAAAMYVCCHYRLMVVYSRSALGEFSAHSFLPFILLGLWQIFVEKKKTAEPAFYLTAGFVSLIYTHVLSVMMSSILALLVALIAWRQTLSVRVFKILALACLLIGLLGAAFYVPFMDYWLNVDLYLHHFYGTSDGATLLDLLNVWAVDFVVSHKNFVENKTLGLALTLVLVLALFDAKRATPLLKVCLGLSVALLFLSTDLFPWRTIYGWEKSFFLFRVLTAIQFPWRFLIYAALALSCVFILLAKKQGLTHKWFMGIAALLVLQTLHQFMFYGKLEEGFGSGFAQELNKVEDCVGCVSSLVFSPMMGKEWLLYQTDTEQLKRNHLVAQLARAKIVQENGVDLTLRVSAQKNAYIDIGRQNYPYFVAKTRNGHNIAIENAPNNNIRLRFEEAFEGEVEVLFSPPTYWRIAYGISLVTLLLCSFLFFHATRAKKIQKK